MALVTQASYRLCSDTFQYGAGAKESFVNRCSMPWRSLKQSLSCGVVKFENKRRNQVIVAESPPTNDTVIAAEPLTKEDLIGYLAFGCKPKEKWRIGAKHEKFGFDLGTLRPVKYKQIAGLLNGIAERFDWDKVMEGDNIIGLKQPACVYDATLLSPSTEEEEEEALRAPQEGPITRARARSVQNAVNTIIQRINTSQETREPFPENVFSLRRLQHTTEIAFNVRLLSTIG